MGDKVTVACKLPHGVRLRTFNMEKDREPVMGGGTREVKKAVWDGREFVIKGVAAPAGMAPKARMMGGFALTPGVDKDFWEAWLAQNKESDMVKNGLIFAQTQGDRASLRDNVKDHVKQRSGLEPIDPNNLPVKGIEQADEMDKEAFSEHPELEEV